MTSVNLTNIVILGPTVVIQTTHVQNFGFGAPPLKYGVDDAQWFWHQYAKTLCHATFLKPILKVLSAQSDHDTSPVLKEHCQVIFFRLIDNTLSSITKQSPRRPAILPGQCEVILTAAKRTRSQAVARTAEPNVLPRNGLPRN